MKVLRSNKRFSESDTCIRGLNGLNLDKILDKIFQDQLGLFLLDRLKPAQDT